MIFIVFVCHPGLRTDSRYPRNKMKLQQPCLLRTSLCFYAYCLLPSLVFPAFHNGVQTVNVAAGQETILNCSSSAFPYPIIEWEKDGELVGSLNNSRLTELAPVSTQLQLRVMGRLQITGLILDDGGVYRCIALSSLVTEENATSSDILLLVQCKSQLCMCAWPTFFRPS